jgi:aspartokinase/homoserine dehydrogenase 1
MPNSVPSSIGTKARAGSMHGVPPTRSRAWSSPASSPDREDGLPTVLGRNGSDYSGAIFAALFDAAELHIWTDVDGVLSADPRLVPEAVSLASMSYREACELAYFGAKVIHPQTMTPAIARGLPILIRNTFKPEFPGTRIDADGDGGHGGPVKGLTLDPGLALVNLEGAGLIGVPGTAERVFAALHAARISVVMISQGSSEHSICWWCASAMPKPRVARCSMPFRASSTAARSRACRSFPASACWPRSATAWPAHPGVAAPVRGPGACAGQHPRDRPGCVRAQHLGGHRRRRHPRACVPRMPAFWLSPQTLALGVIGPGKVGAALLDQLQAALPRLRSEANLDLRLRALATSRRMWLCDQAILPTGARASRKNRSPRPRPRSPAPAGQHLPHAVDRRLQRQRQRGRAVRGMAGGRHPRHHPEQAGRARPAGALRAIREAARAAAHASATRPPSVPACR